MKEDTLIFDDFLNIIEGKCGDCGIAIISAFTDDIVTMPKDNAIAAARAILKHYSEGIE